MFRKKVLDSVEVKSPCGESWDEMQGNDTVRFCSHCAKSVNNISAMTRKEAYRLIRESNGSLCIQYVKDPATNKPLYLNDLHQITRRAPAIAAGVVAASIGFSASAYAQAPTPLPLNDEPSAEKVIAPDDNAILDTGGGKIEGTITGPDAQPLKSATVTITDEDSTQISQAVTDETGAYKFEYLTGKKYSMKVAAAGFIEKELANLSASEDGSSKNDVTLQPEITSISEVKLPEAERTVFLGGVMSVVTLREYKNALSRAVLDEDLDRVKKLIYRGARINAKEKDHNNSTALFFAVDGGNKEIVELLLRFGAKVNARNAIGQTPIMMLDDDADEGVVELLIKHGASVNLVDEEGNTALIRAAGRSDLKTINALIAAGADVNAIGEEGKTALIKAAYNDEIEIVRALLVAGADVNIKDEDNETAWDHTSDAKVEALLETYGGVSGDPDKVDNDDPAPAATTTKPVETDN